MFFCTTSTTFWLLPPGEYLVCLAPNASAYWGTGGSVCRVLRFVSILIVCVCLAPGIYLLARFPSSKDDRLSQRSTRWKKSARAKYVFADPNFYKIHWGWHDCYWDFQTVWLVIWMWREALLRLGQVPSPDARSSWDGFLRGLYAAFKSWPKRLTIAENVSFDWHRKHREAISCRISMLYNCPLNILATLTEKKQRRLLTPNVVSTRFDDGTEYGAQLSTD